MAAKVQALCDVDEGTASKLLLEAYEEKGTLVTLNVPSLPEAGASYSDRMNMIHIELAELDTRQPHPKW